MKLTQPDQTENSSHCRKNISHVIGVIGEENLVINQYIVSLYFCTYNSLHVPVKP